ncbi:MAG: hypothetical protein ABI592_06635 [Acidobacteriota bacterium]
MTRRILRSIPALALGLALPLTACKKAETPPATSTPAGTTAETTTSMAPAASAVHVTDVQLGKALNADKKVAAPVDTFAPADTIFASVSTDGTAPAATIVAKWTFQDGQTVKRDSRTISPSGPAVTEFSIQKPDGWPKGNYQVEIAIDGQPATATTRSFKIQ